MTISCQQCKPEDTGCSNCGGFKVRLEKYTCPCGHSYWDYIRTGTTIYDGKRYRAFDGLEIICRFGSPNECSKCENS